MTTPIKVEQVDREAAADLGFVDPHSSILRRWKREVMSGELDDDPTVQAFARHRLAAEAKAFEEAARIADEEAAERREDQKRDLLSNYIRGQLNAAVRIATAIRSRIPEIKA